MDIGMGSGKDKGMAVGGTIPDCRASDWDKKTELCHQKPQRMI
jgi:hypothetical protein